MQFTRTDVALSHGMFRVKGDVLEVFPADEEIIIRIDFFGDEIDKIMSVDPTTGEIVKEVNRYTLFPASHFVTSWDRLESAIQSIQAELDDRLQWFRDRSQLLEAQRLEQRTRYD